MHKKFNEVSLQPSLQESLKRMGFETMTPIQEKSIPAALFGRDVIACAQTGTGKTAAYLVPSFEKMLLDHKRATLVLAPTRELAMQIFEVAKELLPQGSGIKLALLVGGMSFQPQYRALQAKPRLIIATPGRLNDHLRQGTAALDAFSGLILDEADRMLDMGFAPQLKQIMRFLPRERQTMLFTATLTDEMKRLSASFLNNPMRVTIGQSSRPAENIEQQVIQTKPEKKRELLMSELDKRAGSVIVFLRTQVSTDRLARFLTENGHNVTRIHGGRSQAQRKHAVTGFRDGKYRVLVATDIAARGLDIAHVSHVINFDLPEQPEDYVHRIGRTARAGAKGQALSFVTPQEQRHWKVITRLINA